MLVAKVAQEAEPSRINMAFHLIRPVPMCVAKVLPAQGMVCSTVVVQHMVVRAVVLGVQTILKQQRMAQILRPC
jgi:hypothetical protein